MNAGEYKLTNETSHNMLEAIRLNTDEAMQNETQHLQPIDRLVELLQPIGLLRFGDDAFITTSPWQRLLANDNIIAFTIIGGTYT